MIPALFHVTSESEFIKLFQLIAVLDSILSEQVFYSASLETVEIVRVAIFLVAIMQKNGPKKHCACWWSMYTKINMSKFLLLNIKFFHQKINKHLLSSATIMPR